MPKTNKKSATTPSGSAPVRLKRPMELFGQYTGVPAPITPGSHWEKLRDEPAATPYKDFPCPFSHNTINCNKIRKAKPNPLIGNCVVRSTPRNEPDEDWIVCPKRFLQGQTVFNDCKHLLNPKCEKIYLAQEVELAGYGNVDFALIGYDANGDILDFLAIEVQGMGTSSSGPIWNARNDYLSGTLKNEYSYSLNEKDASKKILVQLLHKGAQISRWRYRLVLLIQDHFMTHLRSAYNINAHFHPEDAQDFIYIFSYKLEFDSSATNMVGTRFSLRKVEGISTDIIGLSMALIGNPNTGYLDFNTLATRLDEKKDAGTLIQI